MHRLLRLTLACLASGTCLWPVAAAAQAQDASAGPRFSVDAVRGGFATRGYQVDQGVTWNWTSPPVTALQIRDSRDDRLVMALIYPDATAAHVERRQAQARDGLAMTGGDPHLIPGYGPSVWLGNVALVQTNRWQLDRLYQAQTDRDNCVYVDSDLLPDPSTPNLPVDLEFQDALHISAVNL